MKKSLLSVLFLLLSLSLIFMVSCGQEDSEAKVPEGYWFNEEAFAQIYFADGTYQLVTETDEFSGSYKSVDKGTVEITLDGETASKVHFDENNDLSIDGIPGIFKSVAESQFKG